MCWLFCFIFKGERTGEKIGKRNERRHYTLTHRNQIRYTDQDTQAENVGRFLMFCLKRKKKEYLFLLEEITQCNLQLNQKRRELMVNAQKKIQGIKKNERERLIEVGML